jgi:hypothetical protein
MRFFVLGLLLLPVCALGGAQKTTRAKTPAVITVPNTPETADAERSFEDRRFQVKFTVPAGWQLTQKDGEVSTFHTDARSAPRESQLRAVAILNFNPFPASTLAGALFYYSVQPRTTDVDCERQATGQPTGSTVASRGTKDVQAIGGMNFAHGHTESGGICTEARDEVYTAYHKHACYRFDLTINTFCSVSSGAREITDQQVRKIDDRMTDILSTVALGWQKGG